jgi:hypothetical protein
MRNRFKRVAAVASAAGLALAGVTVPASSAYADWAPTCVYVYGPPVLQKALVENHCSTTQRVRVIVSWGPDSSCVELQPNWYFTYEWWPGSYDGLQLC